MQPLALMAWYRELPASVTPAQVRCGLTAVLKRMFANGDNFNEGGFLTIGFTGRQPNVADWYTNNGSIYDLARLPSAGTSGKRCLLDRCSARLDQQESMERPTLPEGPSLER